MFIINFLMSSEIAVINKIAEFVLKLYLFGSFFISIECVKCLLSFIRILYLV